MTTRPASHVRGQRGFTLVELLVVIGIIGALIGILVPAVQKVRESSSRTEAQNNLKQIGLGAHAAHSAHGRFPMMYGNYGGKDGTVFYHLLPYIDQQPLWNQGQDVARQTAIKTFRHPADPTWPLDGVYQLTVASDIPSWASASTTWGVSSFAANWQFFGDKGIRLANVGDGTANTIMFNEKYAIAKNNGNVTGAGLWGYGVRPVTTVAERLAMATPAKFPTTPGTTPDNDYQYAKGWWARTGFVNNPSTSGVEGQWPNTAAQKVNWNFRCMRCAEWQPNPNQLNAFKSQSMGPDGMLACFADGSVRTVVAGTSDEEFCALESPALSEVVSNPQN